MDHYSNSSVPPISRQSRHHSRRKSQQDPTAHASTSRSTETHYHITRDLKSRGGHVAPASPEVISSLITSLSVISQPANGHFDNPRASPYSSQPTSPFRGSFGVDYGAYLQPSTDERKEEPDLDELAASPPIIRTSKPPSGFSPLTAPAKSPRSEGGFKSVFRGSSRPSSKGSSTSRDADTQSIGNLSVERGSTPGPELRRQKSYDSWGKKQGRSQRGLMYMSSKERLREKEDRKRSSTGAAGGDTSGARSSMGSRTDPFLAETPIREEPSNQSDAPTTEPLSAGGSRRVSSDSSAPRAIPTRDSSLRKTSTNAKRSSRSKRHSDNGGTDVLPEIEEGMKYRDRDAPQRKPKLATGGGHPANRGTNNHYGADSESARVTGGYKDSNSYQADDATVDDGAPSPAVSQGRRRQDDYGVDSGNRNSRRRSGHSTPEPESGLRVKRSSSRLKRYSGPLSPRSDGGGNRHSRVTSPEPEVTGRHSQVAYERPPSADSIDDAVESYLCSPRLSQKIKHPQTGRVISFSEVGDSEGSAVFCCVGMGLTRYITAFYDELALTLKLRLITPDRPGVGDSEPYADGTATPLSWPDDVYAICQALKITKFSILAHSAGAIYALATALRMPQHIRGRIHLLAPWIPPSQMNVFGGSQTLPPTNAIPTSQRILRALPTPILKAANSSFMSATSSSITSSLPKQRRGKRKGNVRQNPDAPTLSSNGNGNRGVANADNKENHQCDNDHDKQISANHASEYMDRIMPEGTSPTDGHGIGGQSNADRLSKKGPAAPPDREAAIMAAAIDAVADKERQMTYDLRLTQSIWELATTGANPAVDLLVCLERRHTIGFRYVDITRPVVIHHGSRDTRVPVENVRWLGKTMKRCEVRVLEGEGHGLMASATVMGSVLMEISKEWEDWMRVTGAGKKEERGRRGTIGQGR